MLSLMTALVVGQAHAYDVGTSKKFGIGANVGAPVEFTLKYWFDEKSGVSAAAGTYGFAWFDLRGQYERDITSFHEWPWGELGMYWDAGLQISGYPATFYGVSGVGVGPYGGVAARLRFNDVPAEVYAGPDIGFQFDKYGALSGVSPIYHGTVGGRWYF